MLYPEMVTLWIVTGASLLGSIVLLVLALLLLRKGTNYARTQKELLRTAEVRVREKYNQIALLPPKELAAYLANAFAICLVLESDRDVSANDHHALEKLYASAVEKLKLYIGSETLKAIDYYYGSEEVEPGKSLGYVDRWSLIAYRDLENRGIIAQIITKQAAAQRVETEIKLSHST